MTMTTPTTIEKKIKNLAQLIVAAKSVVVFIGAEIDAESGIPDFRSPGGLWSKSGPADFTIDKYLASTEARGKQ